MPGCPCCAGLGGEREEYLARLRVIEQYVEQGDAVVQAEAAVVDRVKVELCARQAPHSQGDQRCIRGAGDHVFIFECHFLALLMFSGSIFDDSQGLQKVSGCFAGLQ